MMFGVANRRSACVGYSDLDETTMPTDDGSTFLATGGSTLLTTGGSILMTAGASTRLTAGGCTKLATVGAHALSAKDALSIVAGVLAGVDNPIVWPTKGPCSRAGVVTMGL